MQSILFKLKSTNTPVIVKKNEQFNVRYDEHGDLWECFGKVWLFEDSAQAWQDRSVRNYREETLLGIRILLGNVAWSQRERKGTDCEREEFALSNLFVVVDTCYDTPVILVMNRIVRKRKPTCLAIPWPKALFQP